MRAVDWCAVYYMAHTSELVTQPLTGLRAMGVEHGVIKAGWTPDDSAAVQVCSAQTLINRPITPPPRHDGRPHARCVVFVDECHRVRSKTYMEILARLRLAYENVYVVLMTATPYRRDGRGLSAEADALVEATTPQLAVAAGWLVDPVFYSRPPVEGVGEGSDSDALPSMLNSRIDGDIVATWQKHAGHHPTILRAVDRAHARHLMERFRGAGHRADVIDGTMTERTRASLLARLAIGGRGSQHPQALDVLCTGGTILEEGFDSAASYRYVIADRSLWVSDAPPCYVPLGCLVDAAPSSSRGAWIQRLGRVTRPFTLADAERMGIEAVIKSDAVVLSHAGNLERHGFLMQHEGFQLTGDRLGASKIKAYPNYKAPAVATCPHCFACFQRPATQCPTCQSPVEARELPTENDVELVRTKWDPSKLPPATDEQKEAYLRKLWGVWQEQCLIRRNSGQPPLSPKWPAVRFKIRFSHYPDWSLDRILARMHGA